MPTARRMRLSVDPRDGAVRLVLPRRASLKDGLAWAEQKRGWIEAALAALAPAAPLAHGAAIPFAGETLTIDWRADHPRRVVRAGSTLQVGGPPELLAGRVLRWLRAEALARLTSLTEAYCLRAGVAPGRVGIGDPRSRWGSCSSSGDIRYSWRLILAPPAVLEATVAHEVAHRLHMDHSPAFHAAVKGLLGRDPKAERTWLRTQGVTLHAVGRD